VGLLVNVLDPEAVIVGGGLGLSEGPFWDEFIAATRRYIWSEVHRDLPILRAGTGANAGLIGAAAAAWKNKSRLT
jgi:glucokinase